MIAKWSESISECLAAGCIEMHFKAPPPIPPKSIQRQAKKWRRKFSACIWLPKQQCPPPPPLAAATTTKTMTHNNISRKREPSSYNNNYKHCFTCCQIKSILNVDCIHIKGWGRRARSGGGRHNDIHPPFTQNPGMNPFHGKAFIPCQMHCTPMQCQPPSCDAFSQLNDGNAWQEQQQQH